MKLFRLFQKTTLITLFVIFASNYNNASAQFTTQLKLGMVPFAGEGYSAFGMGLNVQGGYKFNFGTIGLQVDMEFDFDEIAGLMYTNIGPDYRYGFPVGPGELGVMVTGGLSILSLTGISVKPDPLTGGNFGVGVDYSYPVSSLLSIFGDFYFRGMFFNIVGTTSTFSFPISFGVRLTL